MHTRKLSIERLAERGVIQLSPMVEVKNHKGQWVKVYQISERDSFVVVAQLSPEFTARLVDRWQELKSKIALLLPDFSNPAIYAQNSGWLTAWTILSVVMADSEPQG